MKSKPGWENREQLLLIGRETLENIDHVVGVGGADDTQVLCLLREVNILIIQRD